MHQDRENANEFAKVGRGRWQIENEGFNIQRYIRYDIRHANSLDYNGMKCHYLLTQIADILLQLYENGNPGIKKAKRKRKRGKSKKTSKKPEKAPSVYRMWITIRKINFEVKGYRMA